MTNEKLGVLLVDVPEPKVLSKRGKIRIMFPYYPHQRRAMEEVKR